MKTIKKKIGVGAAVRVKSWCGVPELHCGVLGVVVAVVDHGRTLCVRTACGYVGTIQRSCVALQETETLPGIPETLRKWETSSLF